MKNANGSGRQTLQHEEWCDPEEHARYTKDAELNGMLDYCVGRMLVQPVEVEHAEVDGWWHGTGDPDEPAPQFCLDTVGEFTSTGLRSLLWHLRGADAPRANALRTLLTQALAELD